MIVTVTLNPAVDEEYLLPEFHPGGWFRADRRVEPDRRVVALGRVQNFKGHGVIKYF